MISAPRALLAALLGASVPEVALAAPPPIPREPTLEIATDPEHPGPRLRPGPARYEPSRGRSRRTTGITGGLALTVGRTRQKYSDDGVFGRLALRGVIHEPFDPGPLGIIAPLGVDYWKAKDGWGFGFPVDFGLGYATPHLLMAGQFGFSLISVDHERGKTGVGSFSPLVGAQIGVELAPIRLMLDVRAIYRWHLRTSDTPQTQTGLALELFWP